MVIVVIVGILGNVWGIFESFKVYWMIIIRIEFESGYKMGRMGGDYVIGEVDLGEKLNQNLRKFD